MQNIFTFAFLSSGVAVLSCTDCSGSSTASSDITDPGSPFSTASSHSEDSSASQHSAKMPPTQSAHHPAWPWNREDSPPLKRPVQEKAAFPKRLKANENEVKSSQITCINNNSTATQRSTTPATPASLLVEKRTGAKTKKDKQDVGKQGKITEYFKSQVKATTTFNKNLTALIKNELNKTAPKSPNTNKQSNAAPKKVPVESKPRKLAQVTVHRKILPAPSKVPEKITVNNMNPIPNFPPAVTFTAVTFPPNLTYIHTKTPKPPDNLFISQFTTLTDKLNAIPLVNRPCINVIQPIQKITTLNNFNCVKLNATVVPIVKLNTMPSSPMNGPSLNSIAMSVETASPTVLSAKPKMTEAHSNLNPSVVVVPKQTTTVTSSSIENLQPTKCLDEQSPPDSDSGVSSKDNLEISVGQHVTVECQKSPILSQPKTIRFPAKKQEETDAKESRNRPDDEAMCRWAECHAKFDTSGALLEHLQVSRNEH